MTYKRVFYTDRLVIGESTNKGIIDCIHSRTDLSIDGELYNTQKHKILIPMAEILPDGSFGGYAGYCPICHTEIQTNIQGNEIGSHECKKPHPMTDNTVNSVDEAAELYGFRVPYDGSNNFYDLEAIKHFKAGAEWEKQQSIPTERENHFVDYTKAEKDFQEIQLDGLNISRDQSFEQRVNTAIMLAYKYRFIEKHYTPSIPIPAKEINLEHVTVILPSK